VIELKGFEMISLAPGETKKVSFTIENELLKFYTVNKKWEVELGDFDVFVGGNSQGKLTINFSLSLFQSLFGNSTNLHSNHHKVFSKKNLEFLFLS
jgi:beta-glucosidase